MTKISCTECRGRLGEVLAAEVAPVHTAPQRTVPPDLARLRANLSDLSLLHAHLEECAECARDLALMRATRRTLQNFVAPPLPGDLRERIRAQIEQEALSAEAAAEAPAAETAAPAEALIGADETPATPTPVTSPDLPARYPLSGRAGLPAIWENCVRFFQRPSTVAWAGGLALTAFCLMLVARPGREHVAPTSAPGDAATRALPALQNRNQPTPPQKAGAAPESRPTPAAKPEAPLPAPLPGLPPLTGGTSLPDLGEGAFAPPPSRFWPETDKKPGLPPAAPQATMPQKETRADRETASGAPHATVAPAGVPSALSTPPHVAPGSRDEAKRGNSAPLLTEPTGRNRDLPAPPPRLAQKRAKTDERSASASGEMRAADNTYALKAAGPAGPTGPAGAAARRMPSISAPPTAFRDATPVKRFITEQIKVPHSIGWGQVSVELSGDARFENDRQVRIVWRGTATAGETINVGFTVSAPRGEYSARLTLQQVQNGEAQTVTITSVPFTIR